MKKIVFQINLVLEIVKAFIVSSFKLSEKRERKMLMVMLSKQHENTLMIKKELQCMENVRMDKCVDIFIFFTHNKYLSISRLKRR